MSKSKQVIVVRKDLNMTKGKMAAQVAHASLASLFEALGIGKFQNAMEGQTYNVKPGSAVDHWLNESFTKVVLEVESERELIELSHQVWMEDNIPFSLITDEGRTEFDGPTVTCLAIGPAWSEEIDKFTGKLRLYRDHQVTSL